MLSNLKHAVRNRDSVTVGGGTFSPDEIRAHCETYESMLQALEQALPFIDAYRRMSGGDGDISALNMRAAICLGRAYDA
jgi:hypothetical protein